VTVIGAPEYIVIKLTLVLTVIVSIDIDIPGLESKSNISLKWLNASTLFLEAVTKRPSLPGGENDKDVHLVVRERKIGTFARAFNFPVVVDQDATKARLGFGVIRLTVPKKGSSPQHQLKEVEVEHAGQ
jgi:HSP20 family molecular chaperone IbpA